MAWLFLPLSILGDYSVALAISNALVVVLLYFSYSLFAQLESIKRQSTGLQTFVDQTRKLIDSVNSARKVVETINDPEFVQTIRELRKLQIIYVSQQDESAPNQTDIFTDTLSRFADSSGSNLRPDLGSVSEFETNSINDGVGTKSKTLPRFVERPDGGSGSNDGLLSDDTNSINDVNSEQNKSTAVPQNLPDLPENPISPLSSELEDEHRGAVTLLSSELQDDDRGEDLPEQSDSSATQLNLDDGYGDDGVTGDDFDLPVFGLGFAKLVEEMQLEGFVNEQQSEFLEDIFHSNSRGIFLRNFLQEYNRSPEDLHRLKMDLRTFASNPEEFTGEHVTAEDQYSVCASVGSVTTLNSTTEKRMV